MLSKSKRPGRRVISRCSSNFLPFTICSWYAILSCSFLYCSARDTITINSLLRDEHKETLVTAGGKFELGFFTPDRRTDNSRYVGIWYYKSAPRLVVWVANRDNPLPDSNGVLAITEDGNLKVLDSKGTPYWYTTVGNSSSPNRVATLMDSGNLVLSDDQLARSLWESFKEPTDTFLPGMKIDENLKLTSWISEDDPSAGNYSFQMDQNQYLIKKGYIPYWRSKGSRKTFSADEMPPIVNHFLSNITSSKSSFYNLTNISSIDYSNTRLIMNFTGQIQYWSKDGVKGWSLILEEPRDQCSSINFCGSFGSCNSKNLLECKCLPGFEPKKPESWNSGDFSLGCTRKSEVCGGNDRFISLKMMKAENKDSLSLPVTKDEECLNECTKNCQCQAYSYAEAKNSTNGGGSTCWIWTQDLNSLQEEYGYDNGGRDLYVRVAAADIESTGRNCETCGTNLIPYPLSTKTTCGDPSYFSFNCNTLNGNLTFNALSGTYRVTRINPETRTFSIERKDLGEYDCNARDSRAILLIDNSSPFFVNRGCIAGVVNSSSDITSTGKYETEIKWVPPWEPTCTSQRDCQGWPSSTCRLAENGGRRCLCNEAFKWNGDHLNCTQENGNTEQESGGHAKEEGGFYIRQKQWKLIVGVTSACVIVLFCAIIIYFYFRRRIPRQEDRESVGRNVAVRFFDSARHVRDLVDTGFKEEDKKGIDLPFFEFESILAATDNFSEENMLGKGGFGPVYKGKFPGGQEIAVKRLSRVSGQGLVEFKNEVVLIARLQHRNLVRLLGYCIEGGEQILLYEYMPNKSLDSFIFDPTPNVLLDWETRFNIIMGIARGLLYLHQDSRLRIIHRDLKTSNVLLDEEMNPKISDFGLAKIFEGKQTEGSTTRVVGTYGYMSPEYALDGFFSVKSDVFSFGVVVLEIVSGKRNTGSYDPKEALSLLGYTWRLWEEDKALDIMDQKLSASSKPNEVLKCINVGLLCVQEDPNDRPNMSNVIFMLGNETATLPIPKRPAFVLRGGSSSSFTGSSSMKLDSNTDLTVSLPGR